MAQGTAARRPHKQKESACCCCITGPGVCRLRLSLPNTTSMRHSDTGVPLSGRPKRSQCQNLRSNRPLHRTVQNVHPVAPFTSHDSESARPVSSQSHIPSTGTFVTEAMVHRDGPLVREARQPSDHPTVEPLAVHPAAQFRRMILSQPCSPSRCSSRCPQAHRTQTTRSTGMIACEEGQRPQQACHGVAAGRASCGNISSA